ncbi:MAG TPA: glycosyltransferase family 2 protein [Novosphingobium sp.]|nr:glycosyltransferase family 2 protein [Novosphingobium sp.]
MADSLRQICVVIAAWNSGATIGRAVRSALAQPEVGEVIVVDDASSDNTCRAAVTADDGSGRLHTIRLDENRGPAFARNMAIRLSDSPYIAPLDSDDFFLEGRFARMDFAASDWDVIGDNILFVAGDDADALLPGPAVAGDDATRLLSFTQFVAGNLSKRGRPRGELGFLKPVMRRAFLTRHGIRYDEELRLGEDFELYARMLAFGARFGLRRECGYVAVERGDSLSGNHRPEDLLAQVHADDRLLLLPLSHGERAALLRHRRALLGKWHHRVFLSEKRRIGGGRAVIRRLASPRKLTDAAIGIARDKLTAIAARRKPPASGWPAPRFLMPPGKDREKIGPPARFPQS